MTSWWTNLSAERTLGFAVAFALADWIGNKITGRTGSDAEYLMVFGLVAGLAIVDHLHGIRRALMERTQTKV